MINKFKHRKGATAIEFSLIFPVFLLGVFFVFEMMFIMSGFSEMQYITQQAIHDELLNNTPNADDLKTIAQNYLSKQVFVSGVSFTSSQISCQNATCLILNGTWNFNMPIFNSVIPSLTLHSESVMPLKSS
jgi:Flp pilus assembly protein TadG